MDKTQNDLCADTVRIDYEALMAVARYTLAGTVQTLISTSSDIRDNLVLNKLASGTTLRAQGLEYTVKQLIIAAETYDTLLGGISRGEKILVNVPENVKEE